MIDSTANVTLEQLDLLQPEDIMEYMVFLSSYNKDGKECRNNENAKARKLSALKGFWKWAIGLKYLKNNPTLLISAPKIPKKNVIRLDEEETADLLQTVHSGNHLTEKQLPYFDKLCSRDVAIISLLLDTGLRVSELVGIDYDDVNWKERSITIIRKGGDESKVYFTKYVETRLIDYVNLDRKEPTDGSDALFVSRKHSRLSVRSVERLVHKYADPIANGKNISAHKLRATYATALYERSSDIYLTADALGHASVTTTARYAEVTDKRRRSAREFIEGTHRPRLPVITNQEETDDDGDLGDAWD